MAVPGPGAYNTEKFKTIESNVSQIRYSPT